MSLKKKITKCNSNISQFFTPDFIADFMIRNSLRFLEKRPEKVLEPCAGEGAFLKSLLQQEFRDITAYELDLNLKPSLIHNFPSIKFRFENFLSSNKDEKFDLIIGNPPYLGQNYHAELFQEYIDKYPVCAEYFVGNMDLFYFFIHQGILKLNPGGILSYITTNYWITKSEKTGIKYLKPHILDDCYLLQYIDLTNLKLFKDAKGQHNCIFILQKKSNQEKKEKINKKIEIIQIKINHNFTPSNNELIHHIFNNIILGNNSKYIIKYYSSLTNNNLSRYGGWNLLYPEEVQSILTHIEEFCVHNGQKCSLKDLFMIRNGLILIKDDIFILKEGAALKAENNNISIKINGQFYKISESEKTRLKKIYKSKSIMPYGLRKDDHLGFLIYLNKSEFKITDLKKRNELLEKKYPILTAYLKQFEDGLRKILINAKEIPDDFYFPRRGAFIRKNKGNTKEELIDLEPLYDFGKKIFFKFISEENKFGFTESPYYATSDTYFLWPILPEIEINFLFLLAYLNSRLLKFIYKAKNIKVKRSKTKLEYELPIPNLNHFQSKSEISIIRVIEFLSSYIIKTLASSDIIKIEDIKGELQNVDYFPYHNRENLYVKILKAIDYQDIVSVQHIIDHLLFQLFKVDEKIIDTLIERYYP